MQHLENLGFASQGFGGLITLSFTEIKSYSELMEIHFTPYEVLTIHRASQHYVSEMQNKSPNRKSPFIKKEA